MGLSGMDSIPCKLFSMPKECPGQGFIGLSHLHSSVPHGPCLCVQWRGLWGSPLMSPFPNRSHLPLSGFWAEMGEPSLSGQTTFRQTSSLASKRNSRNAHTSCTWWLQWESGRTFLYLAGTLHWVAVCQRVTKWGHPCHVNKHVEACFSEAL